jgi:cellulose synthase/poly-beta-1,6-N-acetylglucosamine synthase-like glycosyltransferase
MKISYAVTVCNELVEIQRLLPFLIENKRKQDEIVVFYDTKNGIEEVEKYLKSLKNVRNLGYHFDGHFANLKNALTDACLGDYIFQIDADEMPSKYLMNYLPIILENNDVEVLRVPRINTVKNITPEHIQKWGWIVDNRGRINWPDLQWRIYKRTPEIRWKNKVHEVLDGYKTHAILPLEEELALEHHKDIERQERQNNYYNSL